MQLVSPGFSLGWMNSNDNRALAQNNKDVERPSDPSQQPMPSTGTKDIALSPGFSLDCLHHQNNRTSTQKLKVNSLYKKLPPLHMELSIFDKLYFYYFNNFV
jgi:hypothetical protein